MATSRIAREPRVWPEHDAIALLKDAAEDLPAPEHAEAFGAPFERFGDAPVVLLGEATHGTANSIPRGRHHPHLIRNCTDSTSSRWKPTGRTPPASTVMSAIMRPSPRAARGLSPAFPAGCGAMSRCWTSPTGCAARTRDCARTGPGRISRPGHLQPVGFDRCGVDLSRPRRSRCRTGGASALWLPDAVAGRAGPLRP